MGPEDFPGLQLISEQRSVFMGGGGNGCFGEGFLWLCTPLSEVPQNVRKVPQNVRKSASALNLAPPLSLQEFSSPALATSINPSYLFSLLVCHLLSASSFCLFPHSSGFLNLLAPPYPSSCLLLPFPVVLVLTMNVLDLLSQNLRWGMEFFWNYN